MTPTPPSTPKNTGKKILELLNLYPWEIQLAQLNLLDSHDTPRMVTLASEDLPSLKLAALLKMTFPGAPCIYYGDEVGLNGGHDPDCRKTFPEPSEWNRDLHKMYQDLIALRHHYPALRTGNYEILLAQDSLYAFLRTLTDAEDVIIAINAGEQPEQLTLDPPMPQSQNPRIKIWRSHHRPKPNQSRNHHLL